MPHSASLTWTASTDPADGYNLYRGTAAGQETTKVNSSLITGTSYVDSPLSPGPVFYVCRASKDGVESVNSNEVTAVILPAPPTALAITAS